MDFSTADEHLALRQAVAAITAQFGNDYYTRKAEAREFTSELWQAPGTPASRWSARPAPKRAGRGRCS